MAARRMTEEIQMTRFSEEFQQRLNRRTKDAIEVIDEATLLLMQRWNAYKEYLTPKFVYGCSPAIAEDLEQMGRMLRHLAERTYAR